MIRRALAWGTPETPGRYCRSCGYRLNNPERRADHAPYCRARPSRVVVALKRLAVAALIGAAGFVLWRWWDRRSNPDWLVEVEPDSTAVDDLDPEMQAKQREADR
ncbi:DUF5324 family protein [Streptomyces sp. NBC_00161]|uniref:DUF5324 family protein n=1 Tax=Streptomyces sp. NBC_00161 TaxID=2975671 RepID=UPI0032506873